jgi:hypothetical protein
MMDMDAKSNHSCNHHKVLAQQEQKKRRSTCMPVLNSTSTSLLLSSSPMDGLVTNHKSVELLKKLPLGLTNKWDQPYLVMCGLVNTCMSIAIVHETHLYLWGSPGFPMVPNQLPLIAGGLSWIVMLQSRLLDPRLSHP